MSNSRTTWGQYQKVALVGHRGWIPYSPWEELEDLRQQLLEQLDTPHGSESEVYAEYEAREKAYKLELIDKMRNRAQVPGGYIPPGDFSREARELTPPENELANARAEQEAWLEAMLSIAQEIKHLVDENGQEWQAELGDVDGLAEFARQTQATQQFLARAKERYPMLATGDLFDEVIELIGELPVEALRIQRLYNWLEMTMKQSLGIGFAFYEDQDAIPGYNDQEEDDEDE